MMDKQTALISGTRGQDGAILARKLLDEGWVVVGFERHTQTPDYTNIQEILDHPNFILERGDVTDFSSVARLVLKYKPNVFYHLAAISAVWVSWNEPVSVLQTNTIGTLNCLEAIRTYSPETKFLLASTSETVGNSPDQVQNEETSHTPRSPYAASKACAEHLVQIYRESHNLWACFTRCYNHCSIYRGKGFVTRKITDWIGSSFAKVDSIIDSDFQKNTFVSTEEAFKRALDTGVIQPLALGNLDTCRDWLAAEDCVDAMFLMMSQEKPDDYVVSSGIMRSLREFLTEAFGVIGIENWEQFVVQDARFFRPHDVVTLCGDNSKIKNKLGWEPRLTFNDLVSKMVRHDITHYMKLKGIAYV